MASRTVLHVDMDAFFAAIEVAQRPELKGRPVVIGGTGDPMRRGVVSTASYEARRFGVHSGMPLRFAYRRCPQAVFLPVDFPLYNRISKRIMGILHTFAHRMEEAGLDEAFLELPQTEKNPQQVAARIKQRIKAETGLTCSVGIAPNKLLAKLASDLEKPDGLTVLTADDIQTRVWPLPVDKLWGVGPKTAARLAREGVLSIGELAALSKEALTALFGPAHGQGLYAAARGIDDQPVVSHRRRKSLGREVTFEKDLGDSAVVKPILDELATDVAARLRQYHYRARSVTVKLRLSNFQTSTRTISLDQATDDRQEIIKAAEACLGRFEAVLPLRLLGVRVSRLEVHSPQRARDHHRGH